MHIILGSLTKTLSKKIDTFNTYTSNILIKFSTELKRLWSDMVKRFKMLAQKVPDIKQLRGISDPM
jgi:hypothetical protein